MTVIGSNEKMNEDGLISNKLNNNSKILNGQNYELANGKNGTHTSPPEKAAIEFDDTDEDVLCGWGPYEPPWLQFFATKQAFLVCFCIAWVLQGMYYTYFVSVITTIEKLFQIQSKTTGMIMAGTEIGQIGSSLLLTYYGGQGHRPKWIAWGMLLFSASAFICSLPHYIYGQQLIKQHELMIRTMSPADGPNMTESVPANLCLAPLNSTNSSLDSSTFATTSHFLQTNSSEFCQGDFLDQQKTQSERTTVVLTMFFLSLLGVGMGQTAVYTLGIPYIDDNVASQESPLYFAITIGVRILGPTMGFILGSLCTKLYVQMSVDPQITPSDPRWVGAWWLGPVLISVVLGLVCIPMFAFPTRLPSGRRQPTNAVSKKPVLKDFPTAMKRLLKNDILVFRTASSVLHILPIAGLYTFLPKYLESQFRLPATDANMISGVFGILVMGLGIIISGCFLFRGKSNARLVAAWIAFTALIYALGMGVLMFIGCSMDDFAGLVKQPNGLSSFEPICETTCACDQNKFSPVCGSDGHTYFSACHAGCSNFNYTDGKMSSYSDCECINHNETLPDVTQNRLSFFSSAASIGYCTLECDAFWIYMILFSVCVFVHSTSEVGSMMLTIRCVDTKDKAMALGLIQFAIGLFGNVPCPIVYGAVVDSACLVWEKSCGEKGACWLYDTKIFRMFYHGTTGGFMLLAFVVDVIVWYKAGKINFDENKADAKSAEEMTTLKTQDVEAIENSYTERAQLR